MFKQIVIVLVVLNFQFCAQTTSKNEIIDLSIATTLLNLEECDKSISSFKELIDKYPDSKNIEDYYLYLDQSFKCKKSNYENKKPFEPDDPQKNNGKGTVTISFFNTDRFITHIDSQRIDLAEFYLSNYSKGKHRIYFEDLLLYLYPRTDNPKFLNLLESLRQSNNYDLKYYSHLFLATYLFAKGN